MTSIDTGDIAAADGLVRTEFGPHVGDVHVGDVVVIRGCPLGRHVGVTGTVTARDGLWVRVAVGDGGFCEPDSVERLAPERAHVTQDGASLLLHRPESGSRLRIRIVAEEY